MCTIDYRSKGIDLGDKPVTISDPQGRRICSLIFTPSRPVFSSGTGDGKGAR